MNIKLQNKAYSFLTLYKEIFIAVEDIDNKLNEICNQLTENEWDRWLDNHEWFKPFTFYDRSFGLDDDILEFIDTYYYDNLGFDFDELFPTEEDRKFF